MNYNEDHIAKIHIMKHPFYGIIKSLNSPKMKPNSRSTKIKVDTKVECLKHFVDKKLWDISFNNITKEVNLIFKNGKTLEGFAIPLPGYVTLNNYKILK